MTVRLVNISEWRTLGLIILCYLSLGLLLVNPMGFSLVLQMLCLIPLVTLHSSLQHECIHGHPFTSQKINDFLICLPVGLFLPYFRFKSAHLKHHNNARISDPYEDPESCYQDASVWEARPLWMQKIFELNNCLAGRMVLGPTLSVIGFVRWEAANGDRQTLFIWIAHIVTAAALLGAIVWSAALPVWAYLICCYAGYSLLMVRTFLEHQAHSSIRARTVIVDDKGFFAWLFLNNNLHVVHHAYPKMAWYKLPGIFERNRAGFLAMNKGYYFESYWEIFRRYAFSRKEPVLYPLPPRAANMRVARHD